jgi:hypothetical protein
VLIPFLRMEHLAESPSVVAVQLQLRARVYSASVRMLSKMPLMRCKQRGMSCGQ